MTMIEKSRGNWGKIQFQRNSTTNTTRTDLESISDLRGYRQLYNSTSGPRRDDERGVKVVRVLAVVGTTTSKRFWDTGVL